MRSKSVLLGGRAAVITGVLLLAGLVTGILSVVPVIDGADYLAQASSNDLQVLIGAFSQLLMGVAYTGIPIVLYPIISKPHKGAALGSAASGILAGAFIMMGVIVLLLLLTLSDKYSEIGASNGNGTYVQTLGDLLREGRDLVNHVATTLAFALAMLLFNYVFYRMKIVPRWLSVLGLVGSILSILASLLFMLRFIGLDATYMTLNVPIAIQQFVLAIWLLIKGFNRVDALEKGV